MPQDNEVVKDNNIIKLPDPLERIALKIEVALARKAKNEADWIEVVIELAIELAAARNAFPANQAFGEWFDSRFSISIPKDERAILIKWGRDIEHTRTVLANTDSRSIQLIHQNEQRLLSAKKTPLVAPLAQPQLPLESPSQPQQPSMPPPRHPAASTATRPAPKQSQAAVLKQLGREEAIRQGKTVPLLPLDTETVNSIHKQVRDAAAAVPDLAGKAKRTFEKILAAEMAKLVAELRLYQERAAIEMPGKIAEAVTQRVATQFPDYEKRIANAREREEYYGKLVRAVKVPLTEAEYTNLVMCCHPDNSASKERRDTALQVLNAKRFNLTGKK